MFGRKKCPGCGVKLKADAVLCELRLDTAEGIITMEICETCGDFWDQSQEFLAGKNKRNQDE